ncbi:tetratricopeptide repeat protein [Nitrosomonas sp. Nm34]|uniref:tetratricopeptide repeat protein n=1 Tax=Nitrosomonas sp. Nm34 TaxID=1881055 RepID=UPI0008E7B152|nr:tetratricopeptide repeat protein [Nitrosomonas sp. Nm34]SFI68589.1 Tetratricopeptide repeat-containing protein [Nitrosomonas sp. Nm34]
MAAEKGEKDAQIIKSLQETIQALTQQNTDQYDIRKALDLLAQGDTAKAEAIFEEVIAEARRKGKQSNIKEAEALRHLGSLAFLHDTEKAFSSYKRSTELDPNNINGWNELGHLYLRIGELEKAENAYMTVLKISCSASDPINQAVAYCNLGIVYKTQGELDQAIDFYQKSFDIEKKLGRKKGMADAYCNLGIAYKNQGKLDQAIDFYHKSLAIYEKLGRKEGMANAYGNLGIAYKKQGKLDQAIGFFQKSLAINEELARRESMATDYTNLGQMYRNQGHPDQAVDCWRKSLALFQGLRAKDKVTLVQSLLDEILSKDSK